jgi:hypothetical protein
LYVEHKPVKENPMVGHRLKDNATTIETVPSERGEVKKTVEYLGAHRADRME